MIHFALPKIHGTRITTPPEARQKNMQLNPTADLCIDKSHFA